MASSSGKSSKVEDDKNFDVYVEGALTVYSQFKRPSKEESESFYNFLKNRWNASASECTKECAKVGKFEANKYVLIRNIEIRSIEKSY